MLLEDGEEVARAGRRRSRRRSTAPRPATRSRPACSSRCSREGSDREEALRRAWRRRSRLAGEPLRRAALARRTAARGRRRDPRPAPPPTARRADPILIDCDPGHDDAIALLLALASPEVELLGVTTVLGNQTLEKTTANALRVLELAGRDGRPGRRRRRPAARARARRRRARPRRERARRAGAPEPASAAPVEQARRRLPRRADRAGARCSCHRTADERRPAARAAPPTPPAARARSC